MDRDVYSKIIAKLKDLGNKINSLEPSDEKVGDLSDLETTDKSSVVNAINELVDSLEDAVDDIGDVDNKIGALANLDTTAQTNIVSAINEVVGNIGTLSGLSTTVKTDIVSAINEIVTALTNLKIVNGVFISRNLRGDHSYNDITMTSFLNTGLGVIITTAGMYHFYSSSNAPVAVSQGLTIEKQSDTNVYRFTCDGDWYKFAIILTTWDYTATGG